MEIDFNKYDDTLVPAIIQDAITKNVLMLGFMNQEAIDTTTASGKVTFFSRSKKRLWTKGEESGNYLHLVSIKTDCDHDTLLITANPEGPTCHKGADTCWNEKNSSSFGFLSYLEQVIEKRRSAAAHEKSYVASLFKKGMNAIAQKVGEEAVEVLLEAKDDDDLAFLNESADLMFHFMILLKAKGFQISDVENILKSRHSFDSN